MKKILITGCVLVRFLWPAAGFAEVEPLPVAEVKWDVATAELKLKSADEMWRKTSAGEALAAYREVLDRLPPECEPFRSLVILRLAQAELAAGQKEQVPGTLRLLESLAYIPEHHALAAAELAAVLATGKNPAHEQTPCPSLPEVTASVLVSAAGPFQTLSAAIAETRRIRQQPAGGRIEIVLAPGTYLQKETVRLDRQDAGLVIRSQDRSKPATLTGGIVLRQWSKADDPDVLEQLPEAVRARVRVCDLSAHDVGQLGPLVFGGFSSRRVPAGGGRVKAFPIPELFYRGEPQVLARWPDEVLTKLPVIAPPQDPDPRLARWAREKDLWLYGYWHWDWADAYEKVERVEDSGLIVLAPPVNGYGFDLRQGCAVNALCELDRVGEWHLDTVKNRIHYLPPEDFDPAQCVLSCFGTVIAAENCAGLQLRDLRVRHIRGDALTFGDCSNLLLARVDIEGCSGSGLRIQGGMDHLVHSCRIHGMGRGGIDFLAGDWKKLVPVRSTIANCRISGLSRIDRTYTPGILLQGMGLKVRNNSFTDIPSSAIRVEACDALVELNYFRNCVYESGDQGAIDMWANPLYRGNVIRWNDFDRIVNAGGASHGAAAVRLDDFISGFMISENIIRTGSQRGFGGVQFNGGTDSYVEGNLFINWHAAFSGMSLGAGEWETRVTGHENSRRMLEETDWKGEAWRAKYPKVRELLRGDDNHNYLVDNQRLGSGAWGQVSRAITFANTEGDATVPDDTLAAAKAQLVPWHDIPVDAIGPRDTE